MTLKPFGVGEPAASGVARFNREFYERIAPEFDAARREPWPFVGEFLSTVSARDARLLDLGCGNGRHAIVAGLAGIRVVGVDLSRALVRLARDHGHDAMASPEFVEGDGFHLPFRDGAFGAAMTLAALHHVPTHDLRKRMLREILRVLRRRGRVLVSVWKFPHPDRHATGKVSRFMGRVLFSSVIRGDRELYEEGDEMVPWSSGENPLLRFVHFMTARELETTLVDAGFVVESVGALQVASRRGPDNVVAVARKP